MLRPSHASCSAFTPLLLAALVLSSCGGGPAADSPVLSEVEYVAVVKRDCLAARQAVDRAGRTGAVPAVFLQRAAEAAQAVQGDFASLRPPPRFAALHRESVRLGEQQLSLTRTAISRLQGGEGPQAVPASQARNRLLLQRAHEIADELGVPECVNGLGGS